MGNFQKSWHQNVGQLSRKIGSASGCSSFLFWQLSWLQFLCSVHLSLYIEVFLFSRRKKPSINLQLRNSTSLLPLLQTTYPPTSSSVPPTSEYFSLGKLGVTSGEERTLFTKYGLRFFLWYEGSWDWFICQIARWLSSRDFSSLMWNPTMIDKKPIFGYLLGVS